MYVCVVEARARIRMAVGMGLDRFPLAAYRIQTLFAYLHHELVVQSGPAPWARESATERSHLDSSWLHTHSLHTRWMDGWMRKLGVVSMLLCCSYMGVCMCKPCKPCKNYVQRITNRATGLIRPARSTTD